MCASVKLSSFEIVDNAGLLPLEGLKVNFEKYFGFPAKSGMYIEMEISEKAVHLL